MLRSGFIKSPAVSRPAVFPSSSVGVVFRVDSVHRNLMHVLETGTWHVCHLRLESSRADAIFRHIASLSNEHTKPNGYAALTSSGDQQVWDV